MSTKPVADQQMIQCAGEAITIRPIRLLDQAMEAEFVRRLSPETRRFRFLGSTRELSPALLRSFCEVDGRHSMAFVATVNIDGQETEIGVARFAPNSADDVREMAITVADAWQHKGLGTALATQLFEFAKDHGIRELHSIDLAENSSMRQLAAEMGMTARHDPEDARQVIYSKTL